jgi:hypothetical protein
MSKFYKAREAELIERYLPSQKGQLQQAETTDYVKQTCGPDHEFKHYQNRLSQLKQKFGLPNGLSFHGMAVKEEPAVEAPKPAQFGREQTYARRVAFGGFNKPPVRLELTVTRFN